MNAKISVFVICIEAIMHLVLYNLHDCTFNNFSYIESYRCRLSRNIVLFTPNIKWRCSNDQKQSLAELKKRGSAMGVIPGIL